MKFSRRLFVFGNVIAALLTAGVLAGAGVAQAQSFGVTVSNRASGKCMTVPDANPAFGTPIVQRICDTADIRGQHWIFLGQPQTAFRQVYSLDTGQCIEATAFSNGAGVIEGSCGTGDAGLFWTLIDLGTPTHRVLRFQSSVNTSFCLDLNNGDIHDFVQLQVWQCNTSTDNQKWNVFEPTS
jgi:hypothetical protein